MRDSLRKNAIAVGLVFLMVCPALAQQGSSIDQLKQQIAEKQAIDRDLTTPAEVRKINRDFLNQQRKELREALTKAIDDLRKYASQVSLSASQKEVVAAAIQAKIADLTELDKAAPREDTAVGSEVVLRPPNAAEKHAVVPASLMSNTAKEALTDKDSEPPLAHRGPLSRSTFAPAVDCNVADTPEVIKTDVENVAADIVRRGDASLIGNISQRAIFYSVTDALTRSDVLKLSALDAYSYVGQTTRTDKQLGTTASAGGSTSAIEKPGWAELIGFAIERGAIQQEVGETNLTLSTTPYAFVVPSQDNTAGANRQYGYLKRLGLSASFNISDNNATLANVRRKNLSQYSAKLRLTRENGPNSREFDQRWIEVIRPAIQAYLNNLSGGIETLFGNKTELQEFRNTFNTSSFNTIQAILAAAKLETLTGADKTEAMAKARNDVAKAILCALKQQVFDDVKPDGPGTFKIDKVTRDRIVGTVLPSLIAARKQVGVAKDMYEQMLHDFEKRPEASLSFVNNRPTTGSEYGTLSLLYQRYLSTSPIKMTFNAGSSFYHRPDPTMNQTKFRDFITTVSFEGRRDSLFKTTELDLSPMTYALTARYQRVQENRGLPNRKADIAVVQFKLDIPLSKGTSIPLALTYANATEFNKEKHIRGNFGFTFDFDKFSVIQRLLNFGK
jgi:hypothetical protein